MPLSKHDEIRLPVLKLLTERDQLKLVEFEAPLAQVFDLSEEERILEYAFWQRQNLYRPHQLGAELFV